MHAMHSCKLWLSLMSTAKYLVCTKQVGCFKHACGCITLVSGHAWQHEQDVHAKQRSIYTLQSRAVCHSSDICTKVHASRKSACHVDMVVGQISENAGAWLLQTTFCRSVHAHLLFCSPNRQQQDRNGISQLLQAWCKQNPG